MPRITIKDVAKAAGVSIATVSNVINGRLTKVNPETAKKIHQISQQLGYQRDMNAASLKRGTSNMVWVLMPKDDTHQNKALQNSPFFSDFLTGIEKGASDSDLYFSFMRVKNTDELQRLSHGPAPKAVILIGIFPESINQIISQWSFKTLIVDNHILMEKYPATTHLHYLNTNDRQMGYIAMEYLIKLGHRNIAVLAGPLQLSVVYRDRLHGIKAAAQATKNASLSVVECNCELDAAVTVFEQIKTLLGEGVTAVLAMSDVQALGCYRAANLAGIRVPETFSLIGMDNLTLLSYLPFNLTTVSQDIVQRGYQAVMQLVNDKIRDQATLPTLVEGETCRPVN